jgi:hypothetical protein
LLTKAERAGTEAEAGAFFAEAEELMGKARGGNARTNYGARQQGRAAANRADMGQSRVGGRRSLGR